MGYPVILNANKVKEQKYLKRALLIYIVRPFLHREHDPIFFNHQNMRQCKQICTILGEAGYIVDVMDINDNVSKVDYEYDLVISHRVNFKQGGVPYRSACRKMYLASGMLHSVSNNNVRRRLNLLRERRPCRLNELSLVDEDVSYVREAMAIAGFGNEATLGTWRDIFGGPIYPFNNYGFPGTRFLEREFSIARNRFLFFGGRQQLLKGLDLLLEVFPKCPDLHLYVCGSFQREYDFCRCYWKELYTTPNIHAVGRITVNSPKFYELVSRCAFVIHPSCSEGQPGSVIQCMHTGLIPIATRESGIDMEDFGIMLANDSLEELTETVRTVSQFPEQWYKEHSALVHQKARTDFSEERFIERWRDIVRAIS
jgi:glycosyltransferase involved in cell wall biosynthesis